AVAVATVAAAGVAWAVTARLVARLRALQVASATIAVGRSGARLATDAPGEIGQLAATFNRMAEALDEAADVRKRLITDLAHELRTPLSNLRGYVEALEDGVLEFDEDSRAAVGRQVDRLERLVADLAALHDLEAGEAKIDLARTDIADVARTGAAADRTRFGERDVTLVVTVPDEGAPAWADPVRTGQVLENLLDNALRYTPAGGRVEVEASVRGDVVRTEVRDTGPGVPESEREAVFRRLYRGDRARTVGAGTGVGLTIAKALVERQGGTIGVDGAPSGGARFWFELPAAR
ncbi:MAG: HAMP domain-containing sensor histidine kinase, partial [Trueperaceae bacterium]